MTKRKKNRLIIAIIGMVGVACLTACSKPTTSIPTIAEKTTATDVAQKLNIPEETFQQYLKCINMTYDDYIESLKNNNVDIETLKSDIETKYECTYKEYVDTIILVNSTTAPSLADYYTLTSKYSLYDAYFSKALLSEDNKKIKDYDISVNIADTNSDVYAFDCMSKCNNDFMVYVSTLDSAFGCNSVKFTNITLLGGRGIKKPTETNKLLDKLFEFDENTNEILEPITIPVMTMYFDNENKNITLALSNELGLIFRTDGADSFDKMLKLKNIDFQIRDAKPRIESDK